MITELRVPALRMTQGPERQVYAFGIDGKVLHRFAAVSRIGRDDDAAIKGYQRPRCSRTSTRSARTSSPSRR